MHQPSVYINSPALLSNFADFHDLRLRYRTVNLLTLQLILVEPLLLQLSFQGSDLRFSLRVAVISWSCQVG